MEGNLAKELRYTDERNPEWSAEAARTFTVTGYPDDRDPVLLRLSGRCPRCKHSVEHTEPLLVVSGIRPPTADELAKIHADLRAKGVTTGPLLPAEFSIRCSCKTKHPGAPDTGHAGCGAVWRMRIEPVGGDDMSGTANLLAAKRGGLHPVPPHDPVGDGGEADERARIAEAVKDNLARVRKTAENWRTGMAGLITLVTAILLFKGKASITDYQHEAQIALGVLAVSALGCGLGSLWLFLRAAHGKPEVVSVDTLAERTLDGHNFQLAREAIADLANAQWLAIISAAAFAAAILVSWYAPAKPADPPAMFKAELHEPAGATVCGELQGQNGTSTVLKVKGEPGERQIPTGQLVSVVLVPAC